MDYLLVKLGWYVLFAFFIGACVGWYSCGRTED